MATPAKLGRLQALGNETLHRPCVDENTLWLGLLGALGVALSDMNAFDAGLLGKLAPFFARLRHFEFKADIFGDVEQSLLDEPGHHSRIGAAAGDRGGTPRLLAACG